MVYHTRLASHDHAEMTADSTVLCNLREILREGFTAQYDKGCNSSEPVL
jgi:hypothetical protein